MDAYAGVRALADELGVVVRFKDESWFMRVLAKVLFFAPDFATRYTTTIGSTVYFPDRKFVARNPTTAAVVLAHELVHVVDSREIGPVRFALMYLMPQATALLALLSLLAIGGSLWWLTSLAALVFLLPWPSHGRAWAEYRGYAMTLACMMWLGAKLDRPPESVVENFTGWTYFRMAPDADHVRSTLRGWMAEVDRGTINNRLPLVKPLRDIFSRCPL